MLQLFSIPPFPTMPMLNIVLIDLGHGEDDSQGRNFTESMRTVFNIGIVGKDGKLKNCNVHDVVHYSKYRTEMGD